MSSINTIAKIIGLTSAAWLSGNISALSLISIPAVANIKQDSSLSNAHAVRLWQQNYQRGASQNPPIALGASASLGYLAWSLRNLRTATVLSLRPSLLLSIAAVSTMAIVPFTIVYMRATNNELLALAAKAKKDEVSVVETEDVEALLERWTALNRLRGVLPMVGATGQAVLNDLLNRDIDINIYVRSKSKLIDQFPTLSSSPKAHIFSGEISDSTLVKNLLTNVDTIIFTLGWNENRRGPTIIEDGARAVIKALRELNTNNEQNKQPPRLIFLSSVTWNERLHGENPDIGIRMVRLAFYWPYQDLLAGQRLLLSEPELVKVTLIQPPALIEEEASGYDISIDNAGAGCSYPDLGGSMVEIAMDERYESVPAVMVTSKAGHDFGRYAGVILPKVVMGLAASFLPGFWMMHDLVERVWS
ncbi:hypothetical protein E4T50_16645 [Aureobasidium sp. EXF-12298]|nr:hypothetical protein E4T50_16645 [Aureobasidium sp. EXF-12298]KAI4750593.1 hypothetical protein E4T51_16108 [Aureobasidium sp. EXF-12344]KAI4768076.1 hypothetical protein E4T52_16822 [Aureobasidium sp. EXF-3400]